MYVSYLLVYTNRSNIIVNACTLHTVRNACTLHTVRNACTLYTVCNACTLHTVRVVYICMYHIY